MENKIDMAARYLLAARCSGRPGARLPEDCRPATIEDALLIQRRVIALLGATIGGWKCALPSPGKIVAAPIHAASIVTRGPHCSLAPRDGLAPLEPEIAYTLAADLPPRGAPYSAAEVRQAIAGTHLAFELIGSRYGADAGAGFAEQLADGLSNAGLLLGAAIDIKDEVALDALQLSLSGPSGWIQQWQGLHPDGHPLAPLCWLANFLNARGEGLKRGDVVTTGSYHGLLLLPLSTALEMRFGELGTLALEIHP